MTSIRRLIGRVSRWFAWFVTRSRYLPDPQKDDRCSLTTFRRMNGR